MNRKIAITGAASGIGKTTLKFAVERGYSPISIDLHEAEVCADLGIPSGRETMIEEVTELSGGKLDAVIACAGVTGQTTDVVIRVNYFGAIATLEGLRPLLQKGDQPRAVAISSVAGVQGTSPELIAACLDNDEATACNIANQNADPQILYSSSKAALCRWLRRESIKSAWVGEGILLNAIAPGFVPTPLNQYIVDDPDLRAQVAKAVPTPMTRELETNDMAELLLWLVGTANSTLVGQVIFADGGAEATIRGDEIW